MNKTRYRIKFEYIDLYSEWRRLWNYIHNNQSEFCRTDQETIDVLEIFILLNPDKVEPYPEVGITRFYDE